MAKLTKILVASVVLLGLLVGGLAVFVRFYLTDERLKAVIIPEAEKALGRTVEIGQIEVGLFKGITVNDFAVKEAEGKTDFVRAKAFVLRYDLWPLLERRLVVSEIVLQDPHVRVTRDRNGTFNFDSLAVFSPATESEPPAESGGQDVPLALPVALTVDRIVVNGARVNVRDELGEIPKTDMEANLRVGLQIGRDISSLKYHGTLDFQADSKYGELAPRVTGKGDFDQDQIRYSVLVALEDQEAEFSGDVADWAAAPKVRLDVTSDRLDLDRLLALAAALPQGPGDTGAASTPTPAGNASAAPAAALPPGFTASGRVAVKEALYHGLDIRDFALKYSLAEGVLNVTDLTAAPADGGMNGEMAIDLNRPELAYEGSLDLSSLSVAKLASAFLPQTKASISGLLETKAAFSGSGTTWPALGDALSVEATYGLKDAVLKGTPLTGAIADVLNIPELEEMYFKNVSGNLRLEEGVVKLKSLMGGGDVRAETEGNIGLDGKLDLPLTLQFSQGMTEKLRERTSVARYLTQEGGQSVIHLKLGGTLARPLPTLDTAEVTKTIKGKVQEKAMEELGKALSGGKAQDGQEGEGGTRGAPAQELLKGILGR